MLFFGAVAVVADGCCCLFVVANVRVCDGIAVGCCMVLWLAFMCLLLVVVLFVVAIRC